MVQTGSARDDDDEREREACVSPRLHDALQWHRGRSLDNRAWVPRRERDRVGYTQPLAGFWLAWQW